jgi:hypothetical protein
MGKPAARLTDLLGIPIGIAMSIVSFGCAGKRSGNSPFVVQKFSHFNAEGQTFQQGHEAEDFQISVPKSGKLEQLFLKNGKVIFEKGGLKGRRIETSYIVQSTPNFKYLFYGTGVFLLKKDGEEVFEYEWSLDRNFIMPIHQEGDTTTFLMKRITDFMMSNLELTAFSPDSRASKTKLSLPRNDANGHLVITPIAAGMIATRWRRSESVPAKFYDFEGKEAFHPIAAAMNAMQTQGIFLSAGDPTFPEYGGMFPSKTKDHWAVFSWQGLPGHEDARLFVLSAIDSAQSIPVKCEGHSLRP